MAVDEAILEAIGRNEVPPTLRLYRWDPPCLSLGYAQPSTDVDRHLLASFGWDLVRRPTGGKAILHIDELTYAVIGPNSEPRLAGGVIESYHRISNALLFALRLLGISAESLESPGHLSEEANHNPICFEVPSHYEITYQKKKIIGSAQARRREGILQHGSLPLYGDITRITQALVYPNNADRQIAAQRLLTHAVTVEAALGYRIEWETAAQAFSTAFEKVLNLTLVPGELTPSEAKRAADLVSQKYRHPDWTVRM
jgi:lipoate-protein ligase A